MSDLDLLRAYEPVIRFTEGELFFPAAVEDYLSVCELLERKQGDRAPTTISERGTLTPERLAEIGADRPGPGMYLRFVAEPFSRTRLARWRLRGNRARFRGGDRLARVGILSRIVDALMRFSLFFRGTVAAGTQAAAETIYREQLRDHHHPYYGRVVRQGGYIALQYWFFYVFNDWRSRVYGVNDHEADWEQVVVYLAEQPDGSATPAWVVFSAHDEVGDDLRRRWDDPDLTFVGDHPVVHAGLGSHSGAYLAGEYLTTFEPPAFQRLIGAFRGVARALLPWNRSSHAAGIGIPYVDYHRGDGLAIGPGEEREWSPVVIDDDTPWVFEYQGLWGNDTADPLGGERGPAGPRYARSGAVRQSWGDIVGWAGLSKVAPSREAAIELVRGRLSELDREIDELDVAVRSERAKLRADLASGVAVSRRQELDLDETAATRVRVTDERRRLASRLERPPASSGPHDHLSHRNLPVPTQSNVRQRILSVWSAFSTPVILVVVAVALQPGSSTPVRGLVIFTVLGLLTVEALARRELARFAATLVVLVVLFILSAIVVGLVLNFGWQRTLALGILGLALILLLANLRELARD